MFEEYSRAVFVDRQSKEYAEFAANRRFYMELYQKLGKKNYDDYIWAEQLLEKLEKKSYLSDQDLEDLQIAKRIFIGIEAKSSNRQTREDHSTEYYIWHTVGDDKVRSSHADNDGKIFSWDDDMKHPGEDYNCRCWAEPYSGDKRNDTYVEVHRSTKITIHHANGIAETREGGSIAWRNNNPGNLRSGNFSNSHGAVGENNGFAVFPNEDTGYQASKALLQTSSYSNLTINEAISRRSPSAENNTIVLQEEIERDSGLSGDMFIKDLSNSELDRLLDSIHKFEGWSEGEITKVKER